MDWKKEEEWRLWKKSAAELALRAPPPPLLLVSSILQLLLSITLSTQGGIFHYSSLTSINSCLGRCTHRSTTTTLTSQTGAVPWHLVLKENQQYFFDAPFSCCGLIGHHLDRQTCTAVPGFGLSVLSYRALVAAAALLIFVCKFRRCQLAVGPRWPNAM